MKPKKPNIPETTIETLARSFFKQSANYGFKQDDYLKFVNILLDFAMRRWNGNTNGFQNHTEVENQPASTPEDSLPLKLPLQGEGIKIRAFAPSQDRARLERWLDDEFGRYFLLSRISLRDWCVDELIEDDTNILGVITLPDETPIGVVAYLNYDTRQAKAELRKLIGDPQMRARGFGKKATKLWIKYGIHGLRLHKIYLNTLNTNMRNIRLNEELGFRVEGILRNETLIDGKYHDVLRMSLWNDNLIPKTKEMINGQG